jgi:HPt (histidine-containing phosphotransfer) domain-containing protein
MAVYKYSFRSIDETILFSLREFQQPDEEEDLVKDIVHLFLKNFPKQLDELKGAEAKGNCIGFNRMAHTMKSSCKTIGALKLGKMLGDLEGHTKSELPPGLDAKLAEVEGEYENVKHDLDTILNF